MSREVAQAFLQTVLMFDDQAYSNVQPIEDAATLDEGLPYESQEASPPTQADQPPEDSEDFDVAAVVRSFASEDMTCSVLAPSGDGPAEDTSRFMRLARRADVVILDWLIRQQGQSSGLDVPASANRTSFELIRSVLRQDEEIGSRLRLICIYSGMRRLESVRNEVLAALERDQLKVTSDPSSEYVDVGDARIVFLSKVHPSAPFEDDEIAPEKLAPRIIDEFARFAANGLLPSMALASISAVRDQAHRFVRRFHGRLDPALLSHRVMTSPADTEEFVIALLGDELAAMVSNSSVAEQVSDENVQAYIEARLADSASRTLWQDSGPQKSPVTLSEIDATALLAKGLEGEKFRHGERMVKLEDYATLSSMVMPGDLAVVRAAARQIDLEFSVLSALARDGSLDRGGSRAPELKLGSLIGREEAGRAELGGQSEQAGAVPPTAMRYYLCLQPICDSTHLSVTIATRFPMLPLELIPIDGDRFGLVINADGFIRLRHKLQMKNIEMFQFLADEETTSVLASWSSESESWKFTYGADTFTWFGDVRLDKAHRMVNMLASNAGRIGINEYEYLRRRHKEE